LLVPWKKKIKIEMKKNKLYFIYVLLFLVSLFC
jgi:hypothetical protein